MNILSSEDLLKQQVDLIMSQSKRKPKAVDASKSVGIQYNAKLQKMVNEIRNDISVDIIPLLRDLAPLYVTDSAHNTNDGWFDLISAALDLIVAKWTSPEFKVLGQRLAEVFVDAANKTNAKGFTKSFGVNILAGEPSLQDYIDASVYDNTQLITSIPSQYLDRVQSIVVTNVRAGGRPSSIEKLLRDQFGTTQARAKMIARDQTAKINGDLSAKRQQSAGFVYFQWMDSDDERVRDRHEFIADKVTAYGKGVYRWDNPPLSDKGIPIIPGQDFQCRCTARPVNQREVDSNVERGLTRSGVYR